VSEKYIDPRSRVDEAAGDTLFRSESARDLFTTLYKRRGLYWTILIVFSAAFYFMAARIPETYTATARVRFGDRLETEASQDVDNPSRFKYRMMTAPDVAAEIQLFQAKEVRHKVASDPEILAEAPYKNMPDWDSKTEDERYKAWMNYMFNNFTAEGVPQTNLVVLKFEDWQAERAAKLANMLGAAYVEHRSQPSDANKAQLEALEAGTKRAENDFNDISEELDEFRRDNKLSGNTTEEDIAKLQDARSTINVRIAESASQLAGVQTRFDAVTSIDPSQIDLMKALPEIGNNALIQSLEEEVRGIRTRYNRELLYSTEQFPKVKFLKDELAAAIGRHDAAVHSAHEGLVYQLDTQIREKTAQRTSFETDAEIASQEIKRLSELNTTLDRLVVRYDSIREAYQLARKRLSTVKDGVEFPEVRVTLAGSASPPRDPSMPPPVWLISIAAVALGLFLAVTSVFIAGYFDRTLDTPAEAERELGLPVLATIQNERGFKRKRRKRR